MRPNGSQHSDHPENQDSPSSDSEVEPGFLTFDWGNDLRAERDAEKKFRRDAVGNLIPREGPLRVWLDHDPRHMRAPQGWVHLRTPEEVVRMMLGGRVVELSLDNNLEDSSQPGPGQLVVGFIEQTYGRQHLLLWPRDGLTVHSKEPAGIEALTASIESLARTGGIEIESKADLLGRMHFEPNLPPRPPKDDE